jgi:hypothetical protein
MMQPNGEEFYITFEPQNPRYGLNAAHGELALFKKLLSYYSADGPYDSIFEAAVYLIRLGVDITNTDHHRGVGNGSLAGIVGYQDGDGRVISSEWLADLPLWERVLCVRRGCGFDMGYVWRSLQGAFSGW